MGESTAYSFVGITSQIGEQNNGSTNTPQFEEQITQQVVEKINLLRKTETICFNNWCGINEIKTPTICWRIIVCC